MNALGLTGGLVAAALLGQTPAPRPLFNGTDLTGWEHVGPGRVYVEDGLLKTEGGMGLLWYTREKFGDCTLRVVYRTTTLDDNSGIFIRIPEPPKDPWQAVHTGYEVQILENFPAHYQRSEHQKAYGDKWHTTGAIYSLSPAMATPQHPPGEWNTMEITLDGARTIVRLNGVLVNDFTEGSPVPPRQHDYEPIRGPRPNAGYIGVQNHHEPQTVHFREISVRAIDK
jgi:3-keto-disaccharide hydrolase